MKFYVTMNHFKSGSGFEYSEQIEKGNVDNFFEADDYVKNIDLNEVETDTSWVEVVVEFYNDDADPMFDEPIKTSTYNETITGQF